MTFDTSPDYASNNHNNNKDIVLLVPFKEPKDTLHFVQCWCPAYLHGERVPQGRGSYTKSSVPKGLLVGVRDDKETQVSWSQSSWGSVMMEDVRRLLWGEVVLSFVGKEEQLIVNKEFDWEPV